MAFEWQEIGQAAATLGMSTQQLQAMVERGEAPSREHNGRVEVLIDYPEEDAAPSQDAAAAPPPVVEPSAGSGGLPMARGMNVREVQLAAAMVDGWRRLAEQSDREQHRLRRLGAVAWGLAAVAVLAGAACAWYLNQRWFDSQLEIRAAQEQLDQTRRDAEAAARRSRELEGDVAQAGSRIQAATQELASAQKEAATAAAEVRRLAAQVQDLQSAAAAEGRSRQELLAALREALEDQRKQSHAIEQRLAEAEQRLQDMKQNAATPAPGGGAQGRSTPPAATDGAAGTTAIGEGSVTPGRPSDGPATRPVVTPAGP